MRPLQFDILLLGIQSVISASANEDQGTGTAAGHKEETQSQDTFQVRKNVFCLPAGNNKLIVQLL